MAASSSHTLRLQAQYILEASHLGVLGSTLGITCKPKSDASQANLFECVA